MSNYLHSISRPPGEINGDRPSVLSFIPRAKHAAIRDGSNTDDLSGYLQNALDDLLPGSSLLFPWGTYRCDAPVTCSKSVRLYADAPGSVTIQNATGTDILQFSNASKIGINGLRFLGAYDDETTGDAIAFLDCSDLHISDCDFEDIGLRAIQLMGVSRVWVERNRFANIGYSAVRVAEPGGSSAGANRYIWIKDNYVYRCQQQMVGGNGALHISGFEETPDTQTDIWIENNQVLESGIVGIGVDLAERCTITGNTVIQVAGNQGECIAVVGNNMLIQGNRCTGGLSSGIMVWATLWIPTEHIIIADNVCWDNTGQGISLVWGFDNTTMDDIIIRGNRCYNTGSGPDQLVGIQSYKMNPAWTGCSYSNILVYGNALQGNSVGEVSFDNPTSVCYQSNLANSSAGGVVSYIALNNGGTGYSGSDVLTLSGGSGGTIQVNTVDGAGVILTCALTAGGTGYTTALGVGVTGGTGANATFDITATLPVVQPQAQIELSPSAVYANAGQANVASTEKGVFFWHRDNGSLNNGSAARVIAGFDQRGDRSVGGIEAEKTSGFGITTRVHLLASKGNTPSDVVRVATGDAAVDGTGGFGPASDAWNGPHLTIGSWHVWVDADSMIRVKDGAPSSATDGYPLFIASASGGLLLANYFTYPNVIALNNVNFGEPDQGGFISVNSRFTGYPNWTKTSTAASTLAMFLRLAVTKFEILFGNATNTDGVNPGTRAFAVDSAACWVGPNGTSIRSGTGSPEGAVTANIGSLYLREDGPVGSILYIKGVGAGSSGWSSASMPSLPLSVDNGGTGANTLTDHGVLLGSGTGAVTPTGAGSAGEVLTSGGASADPSFQAPAATFTDRGDPAAADLAAAGMTIDSAFHDWDVSAIVPAGATSVLIKVVANNTGAGATLLLRKNGNSNSLNATRLDTQVAGVYVFMDAVVPCDTNRIVEYYALNSGTWNITLTVAGWWK